MLTKKTKQQPRQHKALNKPLRRQQSNSSYHQKNKWARGKNRIKQTATATDATLGTRLDLGKNVRTQTIETQGENANNRNTINNQHQQQEQQQQQHGMVSRPCRPGDWRLRLMTCEKIKAQRQFRFVFRIPAMAFMYT